jgi:CheY-like chemotaxis protein
MAIPSPRSKVLAVDDTPANLIALEAVLGRDYELVLAHSGEEAISILKKSIDVRLVLMDLQMPGLDGFQTAARIKKLRHMADTPIIFITAVYREDPFVRRGYELGAVDYFSKPYDPEILRRKVALHVSFREQAALLKERERQIKESETLLHAGRKLSALIETLPVGALVLDAQGKIRQVNEAVPRLWGAEGPLESECYGEVLRWWAKESEGLTSGQSPDSQLLTIRCGDGTSKTLLGSVTPLRDLDHRIVGAVVILQDVTEPRQIQKDLEEKIAKVAAA